MADITTRSILSALKNDYPELKFEVGDRHYWSPSLKTIFYTLPTTTDSFCGDLSNDLLLIHELAHATLDHINYNQDIDLLKMERDAWEKTISLAKRYGVGVDKEVVNQALNSYRDWLHSRSICPSCDAIGHETREKTYQCIACGTKWRPNEARTCGLKRYKTK